MTRFVMKKTILLLRNFLTDKQQISKLEKLKKTHYKDILYHITRALQIQRPCLSWGGTNY